MSISVREAIQLGGLAKGRVIAGHDGLNNMVEHVSVIEVPEAHQWFRGNELFLTAFYTIKDNVKDQIHLLEKLKEQNSAALGICYPGMYYQSISEKVMMKANELKIPIIEIPQDVAYIDVISPIIEEIQRKQSKEIHQAVTLQSQVHDWLAKGLTLEDITANVQQILQHSILILNDQLELLSFHQLLKSEQENMKEIKQNIEKKKSILLTRGKKSPYQWTSRLGHYYGRPIRTGSKVFGYLVMIKHKGSSSYLTELTYEYLSTSLALYFSHRTVIEETEKKIQSEFINEWLVGTGLEQEIILERATKLGWNLEERAGMALIQIDDSKLIVEQWQLNIRSFILEQKVNHFVVLNGKSLLLFLQGPNRDKRLLEREYQRFCEGLISFFENQWSIKLKICIAIFRDNFIKEGRELYQEISQIAKVQARFPMLPEILFSHQVPLFAQLNSFSVSTQVEKMKQTLHLIEDYDREYQTNLLETLEYILFSSNPKTLPKQMNVHRNTLNYRKQRIRELLPVDPFSSPYRIHYELAILLKKLF